MFQLTEKTPVKLTSVTPRREKHGEDNVPALSIGISIKAPNTLLTVLHKDLLDTLYKAAEQAPDQAEISEAQVVHKPLLRCSAIDKMHLKGEGKGWKLNVAYGIDDTSAIHLVDCTIDKFVVVPEQGGTIELRFRVSTNKIEEEGAGKLVMLIDSEVDVTLLAPERKMAPVIDASADGDWKEPEVDPQQSLLDPSAEYTPVKALVDGNSDVGEIVDDDPLGIGQASKDALDAAGNPFAAGPEAAAVAPARRGRKRATTTVE